MSAQAPEADIPKVYSITSSARNRNISGTAIPNALAVFKLTARSIFVG